MKPFHRTVNSVDAQILKEVKTKQILFYHDLVAWNDLVKLFNVLDKTPSNTSLSIWKERIKIDLNKIVMYEEELSSLYELIDKVGEYFELISFESNFDLLNDDSDPHLGKNSNFPFNKNSSRSIPKMNPATGNKTMQAKQAYREYLKKKAGDFSKIETEYYHIKEMIKKVQEFRIDLLISENENKGKNYGVEILEKWIRHAKQIKSLKAQVDVIQQIKLERDEENLLLKYENEQLKVKLENNQNELERYAMKNNSRRDADKSESSSSK